LVEAWCAALGIAREVTDHEMRCSALGAHLAAPDIQDINAVVLLDDAEALGDDVLGALAECAAWGAGRSTG
jgi:hypothetical protein